MTAPVGALLLRVRDGYSCRLRRVAASSTATVPVVAGVVCLLDGIALAYREHANVLLSNWVDLSVIEWAGFLVAPVA